MKWKLALLASLLSLPALAQVSSMAEKMRSDGRIYVVVAVMLTILAGITVYLFRLDNKISRIEKQQSH
jgi:hypothetical protein